MQTGQACLNTQVQHYNMSGLSKIEYVPEQPIDLFNALIKHVREPLIIMNIATLDNEFGPLNRSVLYRCSLDDGIVFFTERNSKKYQNLCEDKRISATLVFGDLPAEANAGKEAKRDAHWQVRLFDACATELDDAAISKFWEEEPIFAKLRSWLMECGKECDLQELRKNHDKLMADVKSGKNSLPKTATFTAFKIQPKIWDFYMAEDNCIGDRVQYTKCANGKWQIKHVCT